MTYNQPLIIIFTALLLIGCGSSKQHLAALSDPDVAVRREASLELSVDPPNEKALPVLLDAMGDKDHRVRVNVLYTVSKMDPRNPSVVLILRYGFNDSDPRVRRGAAAAFSQMNPLPSSLLSELADGLADEDAQMRSYVASTFLDLGYLAISTLTSALRSDNPKKRRNAAVILGKIGPEAKRAIPYLKRLLDDSNTNVREAASRSLDQLESYSN